MLEYWRHHWHIHLKEKRSVLLVYSFTNFLYHKIEFFGPTFQYTDLQIWWLFTTESCIWKGVESTKVNSKNVAQSKGLPFWLGGFSRGVTLLWKLTCYYLWVFQNFQDKPNFSGVFKKAFPQLPCLFFLEETSDRQMDLLF